MGIGLGLVMAVTTAMAEPREAAPGDHGRRRIDTGFFIGGNYFSDELELGNSAFHDQVPESAFLFGVRGSYVLLPHLVPGSALDPRLSVELEAKLALSSTQGREELMRESYFAPVLGWRAHVLLGMWNDRKLRPFALLGLGGETVFSDSPFMVSVDSDSEIHWGLGATYAMSPAYGVRGDFRHGLTAGRNALSASTVELHVGFYYSFGMGGGQPRVTEPVRVARPAQPASEPEPPKPADTDSDGLADDMDQCPNRAEILNEIDDEDGCPEEDSDDDGLLGKRDACSDAAEDMDGYEDQDGCPDADNDADGRPDVIDACPMEPEARNGFEDDDGCPDEVPARVAEYTGVIKGIQFQTNSARIARRSYATLDKVVAILRDYPSVRLRISGHTDDQGKTQKNLDLSRRRADAVKWYLVDKGIDASRFETVGYGPDRPIADNDSRAGRTQNRRIEFELLPGPAEIPDPRTMPEPAAPEPAMPPDGDGDGKGERSTPPAAPGDK